MSRSVTRSIRLTFKANDDEYFRLDADFSTIHNYLGGKEMETRLQVYMAGLEVMLKQVAAGASNDAKVAARRAAILEKTREIKNRQEDWRQLEDIFDGLTTEEFTDWCTEKGIDVNAFLEWREAKQSESVGNDLERWLAGMLKDGNPIPTGIIKQQAIAEGIIDDDPQQWSYMRVVAARNGYTNYKRGYWQNGVHPYKKSQNGQNSEDPPF